MSLSNSASDSKGVIFIFYLKVHILSIGYDATTKYSVVCCCKLDNLTSYHMYRSLSTPDIPLHQCAPVKMRLPIFQAPSIDDVMSYNSLTTGNT